MLLLLLLRTFEVVGRFESAALLAPLVQRIVE